MFLKLGCQVDSRNGQLAVTPPFWRQDLGIAEDLVEEVGRLSGFDNLEPELPRRSLPVPGPR